MLVFIFSHIRAISKQRLMPISRQIPVTLNGKTTSWSVQVKDCFSQSLCRILLENVICLIPLTGYFLKNPQLEKLILSLEETKKTPKYSASLKKRKELSVQFFGQLTGASFINGLATAIDGGLDKFYIKSVLKNTWILKRKD